MPLLTINGEPREMSAESIGDVIRDLALPVPLMLVEHNGKALHRSEWSGIILADGDVLELMQVAAGG
jgi:thiamine biosynthesis protein ThiS